MNVEKLLRRADAARNLIARGELEAMDALEVVIFPSPELLALEGTPEAPATVLQNAQLAMEESRPVPNFVPTHPGIPVSMRLSSDSKSPVRPASRV